MRQTGAGDQVEHNRKRPKSSVVDVRYLSAPLWSVFRKSSAVSKKTKMGADTSLHTLNLTEGPSPQEFVLELSS